MMKQDAMVFASVLEELGVRRVKALSAPQSSSTLMIDDPARFAIHGFDSVKRGDGVEVVSLGSGKWKIEHLPTGTSVIKNIKDIMNRRTGPGFSPRR